LIRKALAKDLDRIVELGMRSLEDGPYAGIIKKDPKQAMQTALSVLAAQAGEILLYEDDDERVIGLLAFVIYPQIFTGESVANELMWYVEPDRRAGGAGTKLLWAAEEEAKKMGAQYFGVTSPTDGVSAVYKRFGYQQIETAFLKRL
jgi:GNAT superfamily N-acetyltransferase